MIKVSSVQGESVTSTDSCGDVSDDWFLFEKDTQTQS